MALNTSLNYLFHSPADHQDIPLHSAFSMPNQLVPLVKLSTYGGPVLSCSGWFGIYYSLPEHLRGISLSLDVIRDILRHVFAR